MVHPFHPWFGRDLEFVKRRRNWRADRVYVLDDAGELVSLPVEWTDLAPADPFVVVAAGCPVTGISARYDASDLGGPS